MTESFPVSGHAVLASSGRSVKIQMVNRNGADYVSVKELEALIKGHKKTVQIVRISSSDFFSPRKSYDDYYCL